MSAPPEVISAPWTGRPRLRYIESETSALAVAYPVLDVTRIRDGDTIETLLDLGFRVRYDAVIRLARCNCPEMNTAAGIDAKAFTIAWLGQRIGDLTVAVHGYDRYGRWVADVLDRTRGDLTDALIAAGMAVVWPPATR